MHYKETIIKLPTVTVNEKPGSMVTTPEQCAELFKDTADLAQETFTVLTLDTKNRAIGRHLVSLGTNSSTLVHPREVFRTAILDNASAIIVSHNHPSGDSTPSAEDVQITKQLIAAGEVMGIKIIDHVIIGRQIPAVRNTFFSLREAGSVKFL